MALGAVVLCPLGPHVVVVLEPSGTFLHVCQHRLSAVMGLNEKASINVDGNADSYGLSSSAS